MQKTAIDATLRTRIAPISTSDGGPEVQPQKLEPVEGRERQLAEQHGVDVEVDVVRVARDQDHADREERREDEPDRGVLAAPAASLAAARRSTTVSEADGAAPTSRSGEVTSPTTKKPSTIPSRIEWLIASLSSDEPAQDEEHAGQRAGDGDDDRDQLDLDLAGSHRVSRRRRFGATALA